MTREIGCLFSLTAAVIARAADLFAELKRRGVTVTIHSSVFRTFVPQVAAGKLAAEAVSAFADEPRVLRVVATFPVAEQRRLAAGEKVEVLTAAGGPTVPMTVREVVAGKHPAILRGRVLTVAQQQVQLAARQRAAKAAPPPAGPRATDAEVAALAKILTAESAKRGGAVTMQLVADLVAAAGWCPTKGADRV